ncbi:uncharacterized protein LOC131938236 [Physella acuta]|uniref:uncharacterized protein LOC131938236 n=1 Tax=Physella acuta TaxID=109671 RepID=UPI0027DE23A9|nr:uncharacterized protein LOC131938236 [Physella acuta]
MRLYIFILFFPSSLLARNCSFYPTYELTESSSTTNQACFEACTSDPKCLLYIFNDGGCKLAILTGDALDPNTNSTGRVVCDCRRQCSVIEHLGAFTTGSNTSQACYTDCTSNPKCTGFSFVGGNCTVRILDGPDIDTTNNQSTRGYVFCDCDKTTTSATTEPTTTTRAPAQRYYDCHSCTSGCSSKKQNYLCPANGKIKTGTNTRFVRCKGPCMSTVKRKFYPDVVRGCSDGKFPGLRIPANGCLTHKKEVTCFCTGDRCNTRNMVQEQSRMGDAWWMGRRHN